MLFPLTNSMRRAVLRWLSLLRVCGVPRAQVLLTHHPRYADLTPMQYAEALAWLRRVGMVTGNTASEAALSAVPLVKRSEGDEEERRKVGEAGERALLRLLGGHGVPHVRHVAAESDAYGYDIEAAWSHARPFHLEVKSTTDPTRLVVHLTRHECDVMMADRDWCLAAVLVGVEGEALSIVTVDTRWLMSAVPADRAKEGRWESARLLVPFSAMSPGLSIGARALLRREQLPNRPVWGLAGSPALLDA
ncbi:DUF3883 domain-containing protein [Streptomyces sp. NPDC006415]|uniref:protein NO VEIN domain-containing protein n=1 Tax=Streptomyces sp. NPDC006415 TaxID=3155351 RepID=UPI00339DC779